jgi:hypothetical protein
VAQRRPAWGERDQGGCKRPTVWDVDPAMHPCASVPDLMGLDWPPARLGGPPARIGSANLARGCPRVELDTNEPAPRGASCWFGKAGAGNA